MITRDPWSNLKKLLSSTYCWSLFFVVLMSATGGAIAKNTASLLGGATEKIEEGKEYAFGGPVEGEENRGIVGETGAVRSEGDPLAIRNLEEAAVSVGDDGAVEGSASAGSNVTSERNGLKRYRVQKGDTLSEVAARFGVSLETLRSANPGLKNLVEVGEILTILPVNGILYETREGDSIESVASRYRVRADLIIKYNPTYQKLFEKPGEKMILPNAKPIVYSDSAKNLPDMRSYFTLPAKGWNWGALHYDNAVDIADECGSPVYAAAEGLVKEESEEGYWNEGYGNYVVIGHPNGTETKYAHTEKNLARVGDYVAQGNQIATIGNTGKTDGPTGCHLHFEVKGAKNPFAIR
ncbi:MAG: M23 family metallopeptidase [bacterium]|nr:M23 family metallopeptidase [bacterium]